MSALNIDTLQIEIEASSGAAAQKISELVESLEALERALSGMNLNNVASDMEDLGDETGDVDKALEAAKDSGLKFGDVLKANILSDAIMSGVRALGDALADIGRDLADFAKEGISLASDLEEVQNVVDTTFGDSAAEVDQFAKSAASAFGMSELSAKQFAGTMGAMLSSMGLSDEAVLDMSTSLTGLAGDLASFYNLDAEDAFAKLRSGISGETEPLKQLGINLSVANLEAFALAQGLTTAYSEMSEAEKAALRYSYIMEATAAAQGDFAKTSDSYANQQRIMELNLENLSAAIGEKLLPYLTELTSGLNGLLSGEISVSEFMQNVSDTISSIAETLIDNLPVIMEAAGELVGGVLSGIRDMFPQIVEVAGEIVGTLFNGLVDGMPDLLQGGFDMLITIVDGITNGIPDMIKRLPDVITSIVVFLANNLPKLVSAGGELLGGIAKGLIMAIPELIKNLPTLITSIAQGITDLLGSIMNIGVDIVKGIWEGITSMATWIKEKVGGFFSGVVDSVKDFLGIHSPSRVFAGIGENMAAGLGEGWGAEIGSIQNSISRSVSGLIPDFSVSVPVSSPRPALAAASVSSGWNNLSAASIPTAESALHNSMPNDGLGNADIINAVMAIGNMITKAVNDKEANTYLDGYSVAKQLYKHNQKVALEHGSSLVIKTSTW